MRQQNKRNFWDLLHDYPEIFLGLSLLVLASVIVICIAFVN